MPANRVSKSFQPKKLNELIGKGVALVAAAKGIRKRRARDMIAEELDPPRSVATLRRWEGQHLKNPIDAVLLNSFALICVKNAKEITPEWVKQLFLVNGMDQNDWDPDLKRVIGNPEERNSIGEEFVSISRHITRWCEQIRGASGEMLNLESGFVQSTLECMPGIMSVVASDQQTKSSREGKGVIFGEEFLYETEIHAVIVGKAGSGKSVLWKYLSGLVNLGVAGDIFPIPIDLAYIQDFNNPVEFLESTVVEGVFDAFGEAKGEIVQRILNRLEQGTAIAFVDNWGIRSSLSRKQWQQMEALLRRWKRVVVFSRYVSGLDMTCFKSFRLLEMDDQEIQRFVRSWPIATKRSLDVEGLLAQLMRLEQLHALAQTPLMLDLMCLMAAQEQPLPNSRWALLNAALDSILEEEVGFGADAQRFRAALADLAWQGYWRENVNEPVQYRFDASEVSKTWYRLFGEKGAQLFELAYERGLLRQESGGQAFAFAHPEFQDVLAAEMLLQQKDRETCVQIVKSRPSWENSLIFAAAKLEAERRFPELSSFFEQLYHSSGSDVLGFHWLLAGKCLAELKKDTREYLEKAGVVAEIRQNLLRLADPGYGYELNDVIHCLLVESWTDTFVRDLANQVRQFHLAVSSPQKYLGMIEVLGKIGGQIVADVLIEVIKGDFGKDGDRWHIKANAILALGRTRQSQAIPILEALLHQQPGLTEVVCHALSLHNTVAAAKVLLKGPNISHIRKAIEQLSHPDILPTLETAPTLPFTDESSQDSEADVQLIKKKALAHEHKWRASILTAIAQIGGEKAIEILVQYLGDELLTERAAKLLGSMKTKRACEALLDFAENTGFPAPLRYMALENLPRDHGLWDTQRVMALLVKDNLPSEIKLGLMDALKRTLDAQARIQLVAKLKQTNDSEQRLQWVQIISGMQRQELAPLLLELASDPDHRIRDEAIYGLGRLQQVPRVAELALAELKRVDENGWPTDNLIRTVGEFKEPRAVSLLAEMLDRDVESPDVIIRALGEIGTEQAAEILVKTWQGWREQNKVPHHRDTVLRALAQNGNPLAVQTLIESGTDPDADWPENMASGYLDQVRNVAAMDTLIGALSNSSSDVREYSAKALGHIAALEHPEVEKAILGLMALLKDDDEFVRERARDALAEFTSIQQPQTVQTLMGMLDDPDGDTRYLALVLLARSVRNLITAVQLQQLERFIYAETQAYVQRAAVRAFGTLGGHSVIPQLSQMLSMSSDRDTAWVIAETLATIGAPKAFPVLIGALKAGQISRLPLQSASTFLCQIIAHRPWTDDILHWFCCAYNIRIMPDASIVMPEGWRTTCDKAIPWLTVSES